jgi:hypothetical protein
VTIPLTLNKHAKKKLKKKGRVTLAAVITFKPVGGLANTQSVSLALTGKKKKRRKR